MLTREEYIKAKERIDGCVNSSVGIEGIASILNAVFGGVPSEMRYQAGFQFYNGYGMATVIGQAENRPEGWLVLEEPHSDGEMQRRIIHEIDLAQHIVDEGRWADWRHNDAEKQAKEAALRIYLEDLDGVDADMSPTLRGRLIKWLGKMVNFPGYVGNTKGCMEFIAKQGTFYLGEHRDKPALMPKDPDGKIFIPLPAIAVPYVEHLLEKYAPQGSDGE